MILGLFSLLATGMYAQVRGTVKDSTGEPVPGAVYTDGYLDRKR